MTKQTFTRYISIFPNSAARSEIVDELTGIDRAATRAAAEILLTDYKMIYGKSGIPVEIQTPNQAGSADIATWNQN